MEKENSKLITESEDTFRAALAINRLANKPPNERWELFKGPIFKAVKDVLQDVDQAEESGDWRYIIVWIKTVNTRFTSIMIGIPPLLSVKATSPILRKKSVSPARCATALGAFSITGIS